MWIRGYISIFVTIFVTALIALLVLAVVVTSYVSANWTYWMEMHPRTMDAVNFGTMGWVIKLVWDD